MHRPDHRLSQSFNCYTMNLSTGLCALARLSAIHQFDLYNEPFDSEHLERLSQTLNFKARTLGFFQVLKPFDRRFSMEDYQVPKAAKFKP